MCCPLVFEFSVGIGGFVIGLGQISFFFSSPVKMAMPTGEHCWKKIVVHHGLEPAP